MGLKNFWENIKYKIRDIKVNRILRNYRVTEQAESAYNYCKDIITGNHFGTVADYEDLLKSVGEEFQEPDRYVQAELFCTLVDLVKEANKTKK